MNYASPSSNGTAAGQITYLIIVVAAAVFEVMALWRVFSKAGRPGWAAIVPFYNLYVLIKLADRPGWWLVLYFVPVINLAMAIIVCVDVAKRFGKGTVFGIVGLWLFGIVGYPILGFGGARYSDPGCS